MKFASWNINSINLRKEAVLNWIITQDIDVLGLQEIKCEEANFPKSFFTDNNYFVEVIGQKGYNGVAIISKYPIEVLNRNIPNFIEEVSQARYLEVKIKDYVFSSIYVPNGNPINSEKLEYIDEFTNVGTKDYWILSSRTIKYLNQSREEEVQKFVFEELSLIE